MPNSNADTTIHLDRMLPQADVEAAGLPDIECLVRDYYPYVRRLALTILDDPHEADDAAQETFIAACRALPAYRGEAKPKTWLTSIAVNTCRGRLRKLKVRWAMAATLEALYSLVGRQPSPEEAAIRLEGDRQLWAAVDALGEKHRLPVILRYAHELTVPEIAEVIGTSQGTVHSRLHYARKKLQARLGNLESLEEAPDGTHPF